MLIVELRFWVTTGTFSTKHAHNLLLIHRWIIFLFLHLLKIRIISLSLETRLIKERLLKHWRMHSINRLNWRLVHVLINGASKRSLTKLTRCFSILLLFFSLIFNNSPSCKSQLIIAFLFWLSFLGTFSPRFLTDIHSTALISLCAIIIWSTLLL